MRRVQVVPIIYHLTSNLYHLNLPRPATISHDTDQHRSGLGYALAAFGWWGFVLPLLMLALNAALAGFDGKGPGAASRVDWTLEVLAHRTVWTLLFCLLLVGRAGQGGQVLAIVRSRRRLGLLAATAACIAMNWGFFGLGAATERLSQASLGYYLNPLLSIALGVVVLGERLRPFQVLAVGLAAAGVAWETARVGQAPWIAILVALAFGLYGLFRKQIAAGALTGLTTEVLLLTPLALAYFVYREAYGPELAFGRGWLVSVLLILSGAFTAAPLIWFNRAAKRLPLSTLAFLQFLTPTGQLLTAVLVNGESLPTGALISFALIWLGVAAFLADAGRVARDAPAAV
ncbi:EamA-like transporter family protein [Pirellulimonas nuda]|uniref:EamA-like transporter family protein n=1 Tax=Pirellulimonas nuda TaxID=2528009 RepID=A0A518D7P9_9BACT|nr:EamA family transporter RarD [Pirellulimonas nuda]QDU87479.1 EamA-like transporter family protein [Pirellulimonas nuda]